MRAADLTAPDGPVLEVEDLSIWSGSLALVSSVSFTVGARERVGIIGASGSGKTLTSMAVAGLLPDQLTATGSIRLGPARAELVGAPERRLAALRGREVGMVFQEPMTALNPTMTVGRQVAEAVRARGRSPGRGESGGEVEERGGEWGRRRRVDAAALDLLADTGLPDPPRMARSYPHQLSGGQRQRVVLAMALANRPALLICDEPTTALDVTVQARVLELIAARTAAVGSALLFISHDLAVVASICDRLLVMYEGEVVERGGVVDVLRRPRHEHTRRLLADSDLTVAPGSPSL